MTHNNSVSMIAAGPAWSLLQYLTNLDVEPADIPASIDLVVFLFKAVAQDACAAVRNTQQLYQLVGIARDTCKAITGLIDQVERDGDFDAF